MTSYHFLGEEAEASARPRLMVYWIPQVPMDAFHVEVGTPEEAKKLLHVLAQYDLFQFDNNVKPDYCNAGGLLMLEDGEWIEWEHPETGEDIDEWESA